MLRKFRQIASSDFAKSVFTRDPKKFDSKEESDFKRDLVIVCDGPDGSIYRTTAQTTFDTFIAKNFVTETFLEQEKIPWTAYESGATLKFAIPWSDTAIRARGEITLKFASVPGNTTHETERGDRIFLRNKYEKALFYILDDPGFEVVIGEETITRYDLLRMWVPFLSTFETRIPERIERHIAQEHVSDDVDEQIYMDRITQITRNRAEGAQQTQLQPPTMLANPGISEDIVAFHHDYAPDSEDPCHYVRYLGNGAHGSVDAVTLKSNIGSANRGQTYARKFVRVPPHRREKLIRDLQEEARTIRSLQHVHIVNVEATYTIGPHFALVMSPIADTNLQFYLEEADSELSESGSQSNSSQSLLLKWAGCLVQALHYLHQSRVKHRDIKPANVLIKQGNVIIADFGLAKIIPIDATTKTGSAFGGTATYLAPEASGNAEDQRHGRAADVFALGIILLEIATVSIIPGGRDMFFKYRKNWDSQQTSESAPSDSQMALAQWIWHLKYSAKLASTINPGIASIPDLAFLALDPNPEHRITMLQLCMMIADPASVYSRSINSKSCTYCLMSPKDPELPVHSVVKNTESITYPANPAAALIDEVAPNWEAVKRAWLLKHMWWPSDI